MVKKDLVIVESPAKAKTIEKFLGSNYVVKSSFGHIRDLPKKGMSVDIANNFAPQYAVSAEKKKQVSELKKAAKEANEVWLASDEDREGEAIAWHLSEVLGLDAKKTKRIVFHEITNEAISEAIKKPRTIDMGLVNAQQARRILDRIVGYELSPVLWKKVRPGLSAGRVQSVAVRLIVEREREITAFESEATYKITAVLRLPSGEELKAETANKLPDAQTARQFLNDLAASTSLKVSGIEKAPSTRNPSAPFTTSTLQQEASRRLGFSPKQTMMLAQRLYEAGHITYMRTDSVNLSKQALGAMSGYINDNFGTKYHQFRTYATKSAGAQEAHEAIRPTNFNHLVAGADEQQKKLYQLIWRRALASQMAAAQLERTTVTIASDKTATALVAKGEVILFDGFLKLEDKKRDDTLLPAINNGDELDLVSAEALETRSRGPARYSEASLVRQLEEMGIGRPSTYAPTIGTIQDRGYVIKGDVTGDEVELNKLTVVKGGEINESTEAATVGADRNKLLPTDTGNLVTDFLTKYFPSIVDYDFTKDVEGEFDHVAEGKKEWHAMLKEFYDPFHKTVEAAADISRAEVAQAREVGTDPKSGKLITARYGRFGPMVQLGEATDDNKPDFASIPDGMTVETITLEQALKLFELPRTLGKDQSGNEIVANVGRFGPYVKIGSSYVSIKGHDPHTITLETALELIAEDAKKKAERFIAQFDDGVQVLNGRYGPYITDGKKNAKIPKDTDPKTITHEQAKELLNAAPAKTARRRFTRKKK